MCRRPVNLSINSIYVNILMQPHTHIACATHSQRTYSVETFLNFDWVAITKPFDIRCEHRFSQNHYAKLPNSAQAHSTYGRVSGSVGYNVPPWPATFLLPFVQLFISSTRRADTGIRLVAFAGYTLVVCSRTTQQAYTVCWAFWMLAMDYVSQASILLIEKPVLPHAPTTTS